MGFTSNLEGHSLVMDAAEEHGGSNKGPMPKQLVLAALCGCTGMDVASLLGKMKIQVDDFEITARAEVAEEHPKVFTSIHLTYRFSGSDLPSDKLKKAVDLSQNRYCSVSAMLRKNSPVTYDIQTGA
jgi:putative redox protein